MKTFMETIAPQTDPALQALWDIYIELIKDERIPYDVIQRIKQKIEEIRG